MCNIVTIRIFERDLVEHNTAGGGLGGPGWHNLHPAAPLHLPLGVGGGARQVAKVHVGVDPVAEDAGEAGHGEPEKQKLVVTMIQLRVLTHDNVTQCGAHLLSGSVKDSRLLLKVHRYFVGGG